MDRTLFQKGPLTPQRSEMTARPISILLVENDTADQVSVEQFVHNSSTRYKLDAVSSAAEALSHLKDHSYDVALVDYRFKDGTAFDLLQKLGTTPTIFLTNPGQEEIAAIALERGAYDYLIKDARKNYLMLLPGTVERVLARRKTEEALRESEARYEDLLDTVLDLYFCVSDQSAVLLVNRAGAMKLGYAVSELVGTPITRIVHPADSEKFRDMLLFAAAKPEEAHRVEFRFMRKDGGVVQVAAELRTQPRRGRQITVTRILARDVPGSSVEEQKARSPTPPSLDRAAASSSVTGVPSVLDPSADLRGTERILVVDDTPEQRSISARMLAKLGYKVVTAEHGHAAIDLMKQARGSGSSRKPPFDLVLLDMTMEKDFDGLDTYREMIALYPGQRCIIVSGGGETDRVKQAQELGAGRFLGKPYTFREIGKIIRGELNRRD